MFVLENTSDVDFREGELVHGRLLSRELDLLKRGAAAPQSAGEHFYWNYLFPITVRSKFNLFHERFVIL